MKCTRIKDKAKKETVSAGVDLPAQGFTVCCRRWSPFPFPSLQTCVPQVCPSVCLCLQTVSLGLELFLRVWFSSVAFPPRSLCFDNRGDCFCVNGLHLCPVTVHNDSVLVRSIVCFRSVLVLI